MTKKTTARKMTKAQITASLEALKADIAIAIESATTMRAKVQHALVGCVSHWKLTGSNEGLGDIVNLFISQLGQGVNLKAVKSWAEKNLHMMEHADGKKLIFMAVKVADLDTKAAAADLWWKHKPQTVFSFDQVTAILALVDKNTKAEKTAEADADAEVKMDVRLTEKLAELAALANSIKEAA